MSKETKVYGFRMTPEKIQEFDNACHNLPISFKPNELLRGYVDYIISSSEQYKKTGHIKLGYLAYDKSIVILNFECEQRRFYFEENE